MPRLIIRPAAEQDLDEVWWYIAQDNPINADRFFHRSHALRGNALQPLWRCEMGR
ncbi:type II toxin-antitoxin system RelE/ParE family toxin [Methylocucumis oryzae]|uniref:type II toxin-antitoxin system RelE/ParE family toxin n=1 Tax=Methylocucumis oryzae TaxID=1632867 RepID=UPI00178CEDDD|nr:type II toxin-antitoxin system RelE/ParE family toxin [Methylocucumis oryzae]